MNIAGDLEIIINICYLLPSILQIVEKYEMLYVASRSSPSPYSGSAEHSELLQNYFVTGQNLYFPLQINTGEGQGLNKQRENSI